MAPAKGQPSNVADKSRVNGFLHPTTSVEWSILVCLCRNQSGDYQEERCEEKPWFSLVQFSPAQLSSAQLSGDLNEAARDRELDEN